MERSTPLRPSLRDMTFIIYLMLRRRSSSVDAKLNAAFSFENASTERNNGHAYQPPAAPAVQNGRQKCRQADPALVQAGEWRRSCEAAASGEGARKEPPFGQKEPTGCATCSRSALPAQGLDELGIVHSSLLGHPRNQLARLTCGRKKHVEPKEISLVTRKIPIDLFRG